LAPQIVIVSGDLTTFGFKGEYAQAKAYLDRIHCEHVVVIPGNHDSRNVGYVHFEQLFGERNRVVRVGDVTVVAVDSTEPDLDPVSRLRLRGNTRPCYNVIELDGSTVTVWRKYPFHGRDRLLEFSLDTLEFHKQTGAIVSEVTTRS